MTSSRVLQPVKTRPKGYIEDYRPSAKTRDLLADIQVVLEQYAAYWPLMIRQVYYRLIGAFGYPKDKPFYGKLCHHMANARRARIIPFDAIRDDGISVMNTTTYRDQDAFWATVRHSAQQYRRDRMARQPRHIEVWVEKAGMVPQLAKVASSGYDIPVYSTSGFDSLTAKKALADRIVAISKPTIILHLGDFDPSGESIFRSIEEDVRAFVAADRFDARASVSFIRVALTADQVRDYNLPTVPAKPGDKRSAKWQGQTCQLDALAPDELADILRTEIESHIEFGQYDADTKAQEIERRLIAKALPAGRNGQHG